jgi:hypothetical protein
MHVLPSTLTSTHTHMKIPGGFKGQCFVDGWVQDSTVERERKETMGNVTSSPLWRR